MSRGLTRTPALARIVGLVVGGAVLASAGLLWVIVPRFEAELVEAVPGPGGVTAEHLRGSVGATTGFVDVVQLRNGRRTREVLRMDHADGIAMRWLGPERLEVCFGHAQVFRYDREAEIGSDRIEIIGAPLPPDACDVP